MQVAHPVPDPNAELAHLGPLSQQVLACAGITSLAQLRQLGSIAAYVKAKHSNAHVSLHLLWVLEGAITDVPWQTVERKHRTRLLLALDRMEQHADRSVD